MYSDRKVSFVFPLSIHCLCVVRSCQIESMRHITGCSIVHSSEVTPLMPRSSPESGQGCITHLYHQTPPYQHHERRFIEKNLWKHELSGLKQLKAWSNILLWHCIGNSLIRQSYCCTFAFVVSYVKVSSKGVYRYPESMEAFWRY